MVTEPKQQNHKNVILLSVTFTFSWYNGG